MSPSPASGAPGEPAKEAVPSSYKVICISMFTDDLEILDARVVQLKARGVRRANRSALIRYALAQLDVSKVPDAL